MSIFIWFPFYTIDAIFPSPCLLDSRKCKYYISQGVYDCVKENTVEPGGVGDLIPTDRPYEKVTWFDFVLGYLLLIAIGYLISCIIGSIFRKRRNDYKFQS